MRKPKIPKPDTFTQQQVDKVKRDYAILQRKMQVANKQQLASSKKLSAQQDAIQQSNLAQMELMKKLALQQTALPEEVDTSVMDNQSLAIANSQNDNTQSSAYAMLRKRMQSDAYQQRTSTSAIMRQFFG